MQKQTKDLQLANLDFRVPDFAAFFLALPDVLLLGGVRRPLDAGSLLALHG